MNTTTTAINAAIQELNATINALARFPDTDKGATAALLSATTARAFLRDAMEAATLTYTPVPEVTQGHRNINTLKHLINEVGKWAKANGNDELNHAMRDAYSLSVTCWTEFDEGLSQLSQAVYFIDKGKPTEAIESIQWAMKYMHRWQDRDGAIGNAACVTEEELTGLTLEDGQAVPASFASAKIDRLDDLEQEVKGLMLVKSVFGGDAKLIIKHRILDTNALRQVWPQLLDRLLAPETIE